MTGEPDRLTKGQLYGARWQRFRATFLAQHPLCVMCQAQGRVTAATVVDHIKPHRGDLTLFWQDGNHQALCKPCHDGAKQAQERGRKWVRGADGWPVRA